MKTSVIRYRVADFLKQHPPFNEISEEDLLLLAASGRVIFHESEEYIFRKNQACGPAIWVIQQGSVALIDETGQEEQLRDLLGEGDILGSERLLGNKLYRYSARTSSDVILYSIDAEQFSRAATGNVNATRYLAAQFPDTEGEDTCATSLEVIQDETSDPKSWLDTAATPSQQPPLTVHPVATVRQAATKMTDAHSDWSVVVDKHHRPLGLITNRTLRDYLATGASTDSPVKGLLNSQPVTSSPGLTAAD